MARLRTFVAVDLNKSIRDRASNLQESLARAGAEVKWVEPENLHVTLLFLGEVDNRELFKVCNTVQDCTRSFTPFPLSVEGVGSFPNTRRPRIVWVGVGEGAEELIALHDSVETVLENMGFRREVRRYQPHITLGRIKSELTAESFTNELVKKAAWKAGELVVGELHVMSSELTPKGPIYTVLSRAKLGA